MASIMRVKMKWSGFSGAPGYSVFHMRDFGDVEPTAADAQSAAAKVNQFALEVSSYLPSVVTLQVQSDVEVLEESNGMLNTVHSVTGMTPKLGTAPAATTFAAAVGGVITWRTPGIRNGRRIRGRTFLVPFASTAFQSDGTLAATTVSGLGICATNLIEAAGNGDLGVWARPTAPGATDGVWHAVTGFSVPDMGAVLRSRRD